MTAKPKILVTSAAGKTGLQTALQLVQNGFPVRAFVRRDDHRAKRLQDAGAEVFIGDQYDLADMRTAMKGIQRAYHCAPTAPNGLHFGMVFAVAAYEARIEHVVTLSQWLSNPNHPSLFTREVFLNEQVLEMMPDTTLTTVNAGWFADNYFMVLEPAAQLGILTMPLGDGDIKKNAPPSNEDIASVVVGSLINPASHAGKTYRPTGPKLLSPNEIAATMGKVLGRKVKYQDISESMFLKALTATRPPNYSEDALTQLRLYAEEYRQGVFAVGGPTDAVKVVGGREPESFEAITKRIVSERPEAVRSVGRTAKAIFDFMRILATPTPNVSAIAERRGHVLIKAPTFCQQNPEWIQNHGPHLDQKSINADNIIGQKDKPVQATA